MSTESISGAWSVGRESPGPGGIPFRFLPPAWSSAESCLRLFNSQAALRDSEANHHDGSLAHKVIREREAWSKFDGSETGRLEELPVSGPPQLSTKGKPTTRSINGYVCQSYTALPVNCPSEISPQARTRVGCEGEESEHPKDLFVPEEIAVHAGNKVRYFCRNGRERSACRRPTGIESPLISEKL
jgi:hypothetical protein